MPQLKTLPAKTDRRSHVPQLTPSTARQIKLHIKKIRPSSFHPLVFPPSSNLDMANCMHFLGPPHQTPSTERLPVAQSLRHVQLFVTPWTAAHQASLSFSFSWSVLKLMSIEPVMPSNHLLLCCPLLLPSIFPSIMVFSNELALRIWWPEYWSFSISPSNDYSGLISFRIKMS